MDAPPQENKGTWSLQRAHSWYNGPAMGGAGGKDGAQALKDLACRYQTRVPSHCPLRAACEEAEGWTEPSAHPSPPPLLLSGIHASQRSREQRLTARSKSLQPHLPLIPLGGAP